MSSAASGLELAWVFAYGSNMHQSDLFDWLARRGYDDAFVSEVRVALLLDHRLVWNYYSRAREGGAANVEAHSGARLPGVALHVDAAMLAALDVKEGHPDRYRRKRASLELGLQSGPLVDGWVYVVAPEYRCSLPVPPRKRYLALLQLAAGEHGLPDWYREELEQVPTCD